MEDEFARILLVDDHAFFRKIVRKMLGDLGYVNMDEASSGIDALGMVGAKSYRLVISDWNMAPMDGLALLKHVRSSHRFATMPFIMVTAMSDKKFASVARDAGATHFLTKPFTAPLLAERVKDAMYRKSAA